VSALAMLACLAITLGAVFWLRSPLPPALPAPPSDEQALREDVALSNASAERSSGESSRARDPIDARQEMSVAEEDTPSVPTATLRILVLDDRTDEPLPGVEVMVARQLDEAETAEHMLSWSKLGISGAGITVKQSVAPSEATDEHGRLECKAPPDMTLFVSVSDRNHVVEDREVTVEPLRAGEAREVLVRLSAGGLRFVGKVLERESKVPLEGVEVFLEESEEPDEALAQSDQAGFFEVTLDEDQDHWLTLQAAGYGRARCQVVRGHDRRDNAQVFRLERSASIVGHVVLPEGLGDSKFAVTCNGIDDDLVQPFPEIALFTRLEEGLTLAGDITDSEGAFQLPELPARVNLLVQVFESDGEEPSSEHPIASHTLALRPGEARELELAPKRPVKLIGRVLESDGSPVAQQPLWLMRADGSGELRNFSRGLFQDEPEHQATSGDDGAFVFEDVAPGAWFLGPAPAGSDLTALAMLLSQEHAAPEQQPRIGDVLTIGARIEVLEQPPEQSFVVRMQRGTTIEGQVLDPESNPVAGAFVWARGELTALGASTQTLEDGTFVLGPLMEGSYSVEAESHGEWLSSGPRVAPSGATGVVLSVKAPAGSIVGRVTGIEGGEAFVNLSATERNTWSAGHSVDAEGGFVFEGLADQDYEILVTTDGGRLGFATGLRPTKEGTRVEVSVSPTTSLRISYDGLEPFVGIAAMQGDVEVGRGMLRPGTSTALRVLPGTVQILCFELTNGLERGKSLATRDVQAVAGYEVEAVLN
jgi:hypothetical protein